MLKMKRNREINISQIGLFCLKKNTTKLIQNLANSLRLKMESMSINDSVWHLFIEPLFVDNSVESAQTEQKTISCTALKN